MASTDEHHRRSIRESSSRRTNNSLVDVLKRQCLSRAYENRAQLVAQKRRLSSPSSSQIIAQQLVQAELSKQNIFVHSPSHMNTDHLINDDYLNEQEIYQLMQEVAADIENELQREIDIIEYENDQESSYYQEEVETWQHQQETEKML